MLTTATDKTGLLASLIEVTFLTNKKNLGKGYSLKKALQYAHGDIVVTIDSDGEHKPKEIAPLLEAVLDGIDVAAGSRFMNSQATVRTKLNQIGNHLFNWVIMSLTGKRVTDSQTGLRVIKREVLDNLNLQSDCYEIETEITVKSLRNGFTLRTTNNCRKKKIWSLETNLISDGKRIIITILTRSFVR